MDGERSRPNSGMTHLLVITVMLLAGCTPALPPGVLRFDKALPEIPGPMPGFGPFRTYFDAIAKACPVLLSLPNAIASRQDRRDEGYRLAWDQSTEYCAWIYYTPVGDYELSWIATPEVQADPGSRTCSLPLT